MLIIWNIGFVDGKATFNSKHGKGDENSRSWMLRYSCNGTEDSLAECPHQGYVPGTYSACTSHENDAGVQCYKRGMNFNFIKTMYNKDFTVNRPNF